MVFFLDFKKFATAFNDYKASVGWDYSFEDAKMFGFRMSKKTKQEFSQCLEKEWPDVPEKNLQDFKEMFEVGNYIMGIQVLPYSNDDNAVHLVKVTEKKYSIEIPEYGCFIDDNIYDRKQISCPVLKKNCYWPQALKRESFKGKDSLREYKDIRESAKWGILTFDFDRYDLEDVYVSGKINYIDGKIYLERYAKINESQFDELIALYGQGSSSGGNSSGSGGQSSPSKIYYKDVDKMNLEFIAYENPAKIAWSYSSDE